MEFGVMCKETFMLALLFLAFVWPFHHDKPKPKPVPPVVELSQATKDGIDDVMETTKAMGAFISENNKQGRFEGDYISQVESDIMECYKGESSNTEKGFLENVQKLDDDMELLVMYDYYLQTQSFI
jgi:hypothetical protein